MTKSINSAKVQKESVWYYMIQMLLCSLKDVKMLIVTESEGCCHSYKAEDKWTEVTKEEELCMKCFQWCCGRATELIHQHQQSFAFTLKTLTHHQINSSDTPETRSFSGSNWNWFGIQNCISQSRTSVFLAVVHLKCALCWLEEVLQLPERETQWRLGPSWFNFKGHQHCAIGHQVPLYLHFMKCISRPSQACSTKNILKAAIAELWHKTQISTVTCTTKCVVSGGSSKLVAIHMTCKDS